MIFEAIPLIKRKVLSKNLHRIPTFAGFQIFAMSHFPVSVSTLSATHLGEFLAAQYDLAGPVTCRLLRMGINHTYLVESGSGRYVFRVYTLNWRTDDEIFEEIRLLDLLREAGVSVSYAIADCQSRYIQYLPAPEGQRQGVLFSYAAGKKMHSFEKETHFRIGEVMASFHVATAGVDSNRVRYTADIMLNEPRSFIRRFLSADAGEMKYLDRLSELLAQTFKSSEAGDLRRGVVHLDIWFDNLNIDGDRITLFDFDFCGNGFPASDVAYYVMQLHNIERYDPDKYQPKIDSFLEGYESVLPLSASERKLLPALGLSIYIFFLGVQCYRFDNWSNSFLNEDYLKRFINGIVKRYAEICRIALEA
jgi:Ser/Thr protein kinase RdoA (MazF antagonist)